jgi:acyl carrier protein
VDLQDIEDLIVALLAAEMERDIDEYRSELAAAGPSLPCDSVIAVEIMTEVEKRCGVRLRLDADTARAMRSVRTYAALVAAQRAASDGTEAREGAQP